MTDQANQNLYGFNQETPEQMGNAPIPAGINENVKLVDLAYEPAKEGSTNMCLSFYFEDSTGAQLRHTEWPIDVEETKRRAVQRGDDPTSAVQKRAQAQGVRIKHIATKVIPAERAVVSGANSFEQYARAVVQLLKPALPAGPFRLKVILNNKDYSSLPPYTPFIERQTEDPTKLKIDKSERTQPQGQGAGNLAMPDDMNAGPGVDENDPPF